MRRDRSSRLSLRSCPVTNKSTFWTYTVAFSFVSINPFAVITVEVHLDMRTVSNSAEIQIFVSQLVH